MRIFVDVKNDKALALIEGKDLLWVGTAAAQLAHVHQRFNRWTNLDKGTIWGNTRYCALDGLTLGELIHLIKPWVLSELLHTQA